MWIKTEKDSLVELSIEGMDESVEFSDNGTANVSKEVGERLVNEFESISEHNTEDN